VIPNAIVRSKGDKATYFGHQLARCRDYSGLHYRLPFEKVRYHIIFLVYKFVIVLGSTAGLSGGLGCTKSYLGRRAVTRSSERASLVVQTRSDIELALRLTLPSPRYSSQNHTLIYLISKTFTTSSSLRNTSLIPITDAHVRVHCADLFASLSFISRFNGSLR